MRVLCLSLAVGLMFNLSAQTAIRQDTFFSPMKFRNIGPFRGGRSVAVSGVVGDPLTYYMGSTGGGLWKTSDAGHHWRNISDGYFKTGSVGAVAVSESHPHIVFCGMGEHAPRGVMTSHGDGVYKTVDAGKTWQHVGLKETQHIARIVINPFNPDIVLVAAQGQLYGPNQERGIYRSEDGGKTWERTLFINDLTGCAELSMDMNFPNIIYAAMWHHQRLPWQVVSGGSGSGLYKSTDNGKTWHKLTKGLPKEMGKMAIAVSRSNSRKVYALIESDSERELGGLFVSSDAGENWKRVSDDHRLIQRAWYYIELAIDPSNENVVYVLTPSTYRSIDGGANWSEVSGQHGDYHDIWINPKNSQNIILADDGGAAISFDYGASWSRQDNQPTGQYYRINVDNHIPYRIYSGQQDNTSIRIDSRAIGAYGIDINNWSSSAGGESAFLAFDPDNPRYVLGGSYQGTINILDTHTRGRTKIMSYPEQLLGRDAKDMKYRFNWNAPIIRSVHESNTYFHAAQLLLRTDDNGYTWTEFSPDLTRNDKTKQGKGGVPYTNEAVGAENYGTISYVVESPHEAGVYWVGSDDGLVHLTRNNGASWDNVTPLGLQECLVNVIEVSPHNPAVAYIATTRYKFNDHTPALYKTVDYGRTWTNISSGIPMGSYSRVIREDRNTKDLLFTGTETGLYISWNGGLSWQSFQLNLPITPITDMMIKEGNLIVATSGRAFWILDDLGLLGQRLTHESDELVLYRPDDVMQVTGGSELNNVSADFDGTHPLRGVNPATGVVIYYQLPIVADSTELVLRIEDIQGDEVRRYSSKKDNNYQSWSGAPPADKTLSTRIGLNRFVWDMRYPTMPGIPNTYIEANFRGHRVIPGTYTLVLSQGDKELKQIVKISAHPQYVVNEEDYADYHSTISHMEANLTEMHNMVNDLFKKKAKLTELKKTLNQNHASHKAIAQLLEEMTVWDKEMIQRLSKAYDDVENHPNKFSAEYLFLLNEIESDIPKVNKAAQERKAQLDEQWRVLKNRGNQLNEGLKKLNEALWASGIGAIW